MRVLRWTVLVSLAALLFIISGLSKPQVMADTVYEGHTGWNQNEKGWWYQFADGTYPTDQWLKIDDNWYHFNAAGYMQSGWYNEEGNWYYLKKNGAMAVSCWVEGKYYINGRGIWVPDQWIQNEHGWWYKRGDGTYPSSTWEQIDGDWYHFNQYGYVETGWFTENGKWYYLRGNGKMVSSAWVEGKYYVNENGVWIPDRWVTTENGTWYRYGDGTFPTSQWKKIDGYWYYFRASGYRHTGWFQDGADWYYLQDNGIMATSAWVDEGRYYVGADGKWNQEKKLTIDQFLGITRGDLVRWLSSHENDSYYLGTPMAYENSSEKYGWNPTGCCRPLGRYRGNDPGMNCTGFIAEVFLSSGVSTARMNEMISIAHSLGGWRYGSYVNGSAWLDFVLQSGYIKYYHFENVSDMLASGLMKKGDIIFFQPYSSVWAAGKDKYGNKADCHLGFFWGNTSSTNKFWHQGWIAANGFWVRGTTRAITNQITSIAKPCESSIYVFPLSD